MPERPIHTDIKNMLLDNEPFQYAHLVKFERPSRPDSSSGLVSTSKQRYTYLTDASRDVVFDDESTNLSGVANGPQTYIANKVLKVSSVQEDVQVRASGFSLVLDGNGIGANVSAEDVIITEIDPNTWDIEFPLIDLIKEGFREGDKVTLTSTTNNTTVNIYRFRAENKIRVAKIDTDLTAATEDLNMSLSSDEIVSILLDKNSENYSSFINREVFIYRAYFQNGTVVGEPFLLFKGIISGVGFDDSENALTVTWNLTSHWGDFSQVKGRITSDDFHRALDQNGIPQPQSALKISYAYDKGFSHSETSINILAQYSVQVEKQKVKAKSGFFGIGSKVKVKKYFETETRNTELDFQLQAKSIPVIYGVRNVLGIPVFADTLNNDSSTVYVVYALCEGEIGGLYDMYVDGNSLICNDKADFDARSAQTPDETVQIICRGRADRGDVLGGTVSTDVTPIDFYDTYYSDPGTDYGIRLNYDFNSAYNYLDYVAPTITNTDTTGSGVIDGESIHLTSPQDITIDIFSGRAGQKAAASLVSVAKANNFKIQNDYWDGINTADYWGPNHRLLDTAYVVAKFKIAEGETSIPSIEFVGRFKTINCYNYDKSYSHDQKTSGELASNFALGDYVDLKNMADVTIAAGVQIIDKWTFYNTDGTPNVRFRFSQDPPLNYSNGIPLVTKFKMVSGANSWTMITFNHKEYEAANVAEWLTEITAASNDAGYVKFTFTGGAGYTVGGDPLENSSAFSIVDSDGNSVEADFFGGAVLLGDVTSTTLLTKYSWSAAGAAATAMVGKYLVRRNIISIPGGAADNYYDGYLITLSRLNNTTGKKVVQTKRIIDFTGGIATIDELWDYGFHPKNGDLITVTPAYADSRISINSAMQLMDYVSSPTYGRGLDVFTDLNFNSWLIAGAKCDEQSDVTIQTAAVEPSVAIGAVYKYPNTGNIVWQGTVTDVEEDYINFTSVLGKLTYAWNNWKSYKLNDLIHVNDVLYHVDSAGPITTKPIHTVGTVGTLTVLSSLDLTKVSGTGPANLATKVDGNPIRALKNGVQIPGYSLYDADGVDYWRLLGWDEFSQRYVTKHQTNLSIDTSLPLFDNVNSFLEHFGGIMRYSNGQYYLEVEEAEGNISNLNSEARNISADHIIGKIRLTDEGIRSAFNSLTASYADPANKFESRNISFFNSNYLKADRGVPKKGNLTVPGITNYYNTRLLADKFLNQSRFGLSIAFNMAPRGLILQAGQVIQLQYPRYDWVDKKFRISTLTHQEDATVDIVAEEYDDSLYTLSNISKQASSGLSSNAPVDSVIAPPSNLIATNIDTSTEDVLGIRLTWDNNPVLTANKNAYTEIYSSFSSKLLLTVTGVSSNVLTSSVPHELKINQTIVVVSSDITGLVSNATYYILTTPTSDTFTISESRGGSVYGISNTSNDAIINTSEIVATVPITTNTYTDIPTGLDDRVLKYYWLRHKVIRA